MGCVASTGANYIEAHAEERLQEAHFSFALVSRQGHRDHEDFAKVSPVVKRAGSSICAIFTVLDGHGGSKVARQVAGVLHENILAATDGKGATALGEGLRQAYLDTDDICDSEHTGAVCCTAVLTRDHLWIGNIGDVRAVMCRGGKAEVLTIDHRAENSVEKARIEKAGGTVKWAGGAPRVEGRLAVSRAFGDKALKPFVSAEPDVTCLEITDDCEFLIMASDGLWDAVSSTEAVRRVKVGMAAAAKKGGMSPEQQLLSAARALASRARLGFSDDDITVCIVDLKIHGETGQLRANSRVAAPTTGESVLAAAAVAESFTAVGAAEGPAASSALGVCAVDEPARCICADEDKVPADRPGSAANVL